VDAPAVTSSLVWYSSYGSNLLRERFMTYIKGGQPPGSTKTYQGCRDMTEPRSDRASVLRDLHLYFAAYSRQWDGPVAFVRARGGRQTLGRMYLITDDQFNDVVLQENGRDSGWGRLCPPFEEMNAGTNTSWTLPGIRLYGRLLRLGTDGGHPVLTFSATREDFPIGPPGAAYLALIVAGLAETYPRMSAKDIREYLATADGMPGDSTDGSAFDGPLT
jgi:hypothetical protein